MIETKNMEDFVQEQIRAAVDHFVASVISDTDWTQDLEQRIAQHVQDRITARFSNIETVPDLVDTVKTSVRTLMEQGHVPGLGQYIDQSLLRKVIDHAMEREVQNSIDTIMLDPVWVTKIENLINQSYITRLSQWISEVDINTIIRSEIDTGIDRWQERLKQDFATRGILDKAQDLELSIIPGQVSVTDRLTCENFVTSDTAEIKGVLEVNDLVLRGSINTDNRSWDELSNKIAQDTLGLITDQWREDLVQSVLESAKTRGIEFKQVTIRGLPLVQEGTLNPTIRQSQLETLGNLNHLCVNGNADLADTVHVRPRRLGINTSDPEMALAVWDEEVSVITGKLKQNHAFIGSGRSQTLSLGVNRKSFVEIDPEGLVTVKNLRLDRHRISFGTQVPGYSGTRGDIVFNSDYESDRPFAWICLGAFRWQALKAVT